MTILTLLQQILGPFKSFANGENYFACPFCHHPKKKFAINQHNLKWHCWHCQAKGGHVIWLLKRLNVPKNVLTEFKEVLGEVDVRKYKESDTSVTLMLPPEYKPLWKVEKTYAYLHAITYLKNRGIKSEDVLRYRMGYCETGMYAGRIIVPSYDQNNQLNYFTARSFYESNMKYKNPPVSKNVVIFENLIDWNEEVTICEGMFDAIAIRQNAIPLMGKTISKKLMLNLIQYDPPMINIVLDNDAIKDAYNITSELMDNGLTCKMVFLNDKDPSEIGFEKIMNLISNTKVLSQSELFSNKLRHALYL